MSYIPIPMVKSGRRGTLIHIERFLGCDFRSGNMLDDARRSPDAVNMDFSEELYTPVKRMGYTRPIPNVLAGKVNGFHRLVRQSGEVRLIHAGTRLYRVVDNGTVQSIYTQMADSWSSSFNMGGRIYLLDGASYLVFDGTTVTRVAANAFTPLTAVNGRPFQAANKLSARRRNSFTGNGSERVFRLDSTAIDSATVTATVNGSQISESTGLTVNRSTGTVTFTAAPSNGGGEANIEITFSKTIANSARDIERCRFAGMFGGKNDTRVFLAGNPDTPNRDYQSGLYDATYFPETGYTIIGADTSPIMGYAKQFNTQIVLKAGNEQDSTQFLRTFELDSEGLPSFPIDQGAAGVGCISSRTIGMLGDEPLFLSPMGVHAVAGTQVDSQRSIQKRSVFIDGKLTSEDGLEDALSVVREGKYYLFVNGSVYVADGRLRHSAGQSGIQYEWHYWTGISATAVTVWGRQIWFGDAGGRVYRFFTSEDGHDVYTDEGRPVACRWTTPLLGTPLTGGGDWSRRKSAPKITVVLKPFHRSGADICIAPDGDSEKTFAKSITRDLMSFSNIDFNRFSFYSVKKPQAITIKNLARRFETLQIYLESARPEAMGLVSLQVSMMAGGEIKGG